MTKRTVLIVPPNDPEAVMISQIARALGIQMIVSPQPHGASLDKEKDILALVKAGKWERAVVVEMPGPKTEAALRRAGVELVIIDHHHYTDLDRAHDAKTKKLLPSSLEQFLKLFRVTDASLKKHGFAPRLVRGIGVMDRGYIWALREEGFSEKEIRAVIAYQKKLMASVRDRKNEARKDAIAERAWKARKTWGDYLVVSTTSNIELRSRVSLLAALELKQPTPMIILENGRGLIYVQESPAALTLFKAFGGFTFGLDRCWGYKYGKRKRPSLSDIKATLAHL